MYTKESLYKCAEGNRNFWIFIKYTNGDGRGGGGAKITACKRYIYISSDVKSIRKFVSTGIHGALSAS